MPSLIVAKFGGTSMATAHSFGVVGGKLARNNDMRVVVVSAPGKVNGINDPAGAAQPDPMKVTDRLLRIAAKARKAEPLEEDIRALERRFLEIEEGLGMEAGRGISREISRLVKERAAGLKEDDAPLAALGEELNARLFASYMQGRGMRARYLGPEEAGFRVTAEGGRVSVDEGAYPGIRERVQKIIDGGERIIFPGFFGYDAEGEIRTFARGGSDYTGSVLAAALNAGLYQNFTDADGMRVVEPSIAEDAPVIRNMTHRELTELTLGGAFGVFQYEAAVPLAINGIVTQVLSTFDPSSRGTYILPQVASSERQITGLVHRGEFAAFEVVKYGVANAVGFFKDVVQVFSGMGVSVEHAPSSTNDISIIVRKKSMEAANVGISDIVSTIRERIRPHQIKTHEMSSVVLVGEEVGRSAGLGKRIFGATAEAGVNVPYHSHQGISFILWLNNGDAKTVAEAIYRMQFVNGEKGS